MITICVLLVMGFMACFARTAEWVITKLGYPLPQDPNRPLPYPEPEPQREETKR